ncbi:hypothetical protein AJ80_01751 [Polytolypa hystricis UAMH7299]|uniref:Uncharacterized protein n=1 Tax=Polytolypa hystricis (strain UAMH7299) TaxID=1447883 RepID=A0A2B7Z0L6_POLH7|nr:hypothetical protein AJ80_01751 [Polytolypa hystricis UAMH7299]
MGQIFGIRKMKTTLGIPGAHLPDPKDISGFVVPRDSTRLGLPGDRENIVMLEANHGDVCKFCQSEAGQDNYILVEYNLYELYQGALAKFREPSAADSVLDHQVVGIGEDVGFDQQGVEISASGPYRAMDDAQLELRLSKLKGLSLETCPESY